MTAAQYSEPLEAETDNVAETLDFASAHQLVSDPLSCFSVDNSKRHIMLPPRHLGNVVYGVRELLDSELYKYSERVQGVPLAYDKLRFHGRRGHIVGSQPLLHFHVDSEYVVFRPVVGCTLLGSVNKVGRDHLGLLVHGIFNATVPKPKEAMAQPAFSLGQKIIFDVAKIYQQNGVISMRGKLRPDSFSIASVRGMKRKAEELELLLTKNFDEQTTPRRKKKKHSTEEDSTSTPDVVGMPSNEGPSKEKKKKKKKRKDADLSLSQSTEEFMGSPEDVSLPAIRSLNHPGIESSTPANVNRASTFKLPGQRVGRLEAPDIPMSPITALFTSSDSGDSGIGAVSFTGDTNVLSLVDESINKDSMDLSTTAKSKKKKKSKKLKS